METLTHAPDDQGLLGLLEAHEADDEIDGGQQATRWIARTRFYVESFKKHRPDWATATDQDALFVQGLQPETCLYMTKTQIAAAVGISTRQLDTLLEDDAIVEELLAWRTSHGRNAHWRFPIDAPERLRTVLRHTGRAA